MKLYGVSRLILLATLVAMIFQGCRKEEAYDELPTPIIVELHEEFSEQKRSLALTFRTIEDYPCGNFKIIYSKVNSSDGIEIDFKGLYAPRMCITIVGPALGQTVLGEMTNSTFPVEFSYGKSKMHSVFTITEYQLSISLSSPADLVFFPDLSFTRVPDSYFWGYISALTGNDNEMFFNDMLQEGALSPELEDGHYGFFRIIADTVQLNPYGNSNTPANAQTFVFDMEGDFENIQQRALEYKDTHEIQLFSAQGHDYYNQLGK